MFDTTRDFLKKIGLPSGDLNHLPTSNKKFSDGCDFRIEIPTINSLDAAETILSESNKLGFTINRITETQGIFRYLKSDISSWVEMCNNYGCDLVMSVGPRATYDIGGTVNSEQGKTIAYRLRGQEQLIRGIEDVKRGIEQGVENFLIYDEGMLWVLNEMRKENEIPENIHFKVSAHCGHSNPAALKLLESIGADSINPVRDLTLPMIAALREAIAIPLDCHIDNPITSGGFIRTYEAPEIVRIASPVYIKTGNSAIAKHGSVTTANDAKRMAVQASIALEMITKYYPEAKQSMMKITKLKILKN